MYMWAFSKAVSVAWAELGSADNTRYTERAQRKAAANR